MQPSNENAFGVALLAGRVVGTVTGSTGHITVRATCKAKINGRWATVPFEDSTHVFFDVPQPDGEWADKIGTFYGPQAEKWQGRFFEDRAQTDSKRIAAAKYLMRVISGEIAGDHVLKSERCARCSRELTHPDSITGQFGPECIKHVAPYMKNASGSGDHEEKANDVIAQDKEHADKERAEFLRNASDDELDAYMAKFDGRTDAVAYEAVMAGANERGRRNRERDAREEFEATRALPVDQGDISAQSIDSNDVSEAGQLEEDMLQKIERAGGFQPPKPDVSRARVEDVAPKPRATSDQIVAVLRRGDDPTQVLASLDAE